MANELLLEQARQRLQEIRQGGGSDMDRARQRLQEIRTANVDTSGLDSKNVSKLSSLSTRIKEAFGRTQEEMGKTADIYTEGKIGAPRAAATITGEAIGGAFDIGSQLPVIKQGLELFGAGISALSETAPIEKAGEALAPTTQKVIDWYEGLSPEDQKAVKAAGNILAVIPAGKVAERGVAAATKIAEKVPVLAEKGVETARTIERTLRKNTTTDTEVVGKILQGTKKDIAPGLEVLRNIDTTGVKTYSDLNTVLRGKIKNLSRNVDEQLLQDTIPKKLSDLIKAEKVGEKTVTTNYVQKALDSLEELYIKTESPVDATRISQLRDKAISTGLTAQEINNIAREFGTEFGQKAFSKRTGEALTSVNAEAFENIRKGVKDTARQFMPDDATKAIDLEISKIYNTQRLVERMSEAVNKLEQKVSGRGLVEIISRRIAETIDIATLGGPKAFITKLFFPSNVGMKTLNSLDLQEQLSRNLKLIQGIENASDTIIVDTIVNYAKSLKKKAGLSIEDVSGVSPLTKEAQKYATAEEFVKAQPTYYHGTDASFDKFDVSKLGTATGAKDTQLGIHFTDNKNIAKTFGKNLVEVKLDIKKPFRIWDFIGRSEKYDELYKIMGGEKSGIDFDEFVGIMDDALAWDNTQFKEALLQKGVVERIRGAGYDSLILPHAETDILQAAQEGIKNVKGQEIIVFNPSQIKTKSQLTDIWNKAKGVKGD